MNLTEMDTALQDVRFENYTFKIGHKNGVPFLQASYPEVDVYTGAPATQHTRKWQLSEHMTKSELIQTAFKCVMTSAEHRVRESFLYRDKRIFGPHFDVDALHAICEQTDVRKPA